MGRRLGRPDGPPPGTGGARGGRLFVGTWARAGSLDGCGSGVPASGRGGRPQVPGTGGAWEAVPCAAPSSPTLPWPRSRSCSPTATSCPTSPSAAPCARRAAGAQVDPLLPGPTDAHGAVGGRRTTSACSRRGRGSASCGTPSCTPRPPSSTTRWRWWARPTSIPGPSTSTWRSWPTSSTRRRARGGRPAAGTLGAGRGDRPRHPGAAALVRSAAGGHGGAAPLLALESLGTHGPSRPHRQAVRAPGRLPRPELAHPQGGPLRAGGPNGAGKTTLLRILAGEDAADAGDVHRSGGLTVGYLPQEVESIREGTVLRVVLDGAAEIVGVEHRLRHLEGELAALTPGIREALTAAYGDLRHRFEVLGGPRGGESPRHPLRPGRGGGTL